MTDRTNSQRQQNRRKREKEWLESQGFVSWESVHTRLMNGELVLVKVKKTENKKKSK